MDMAKVGQVVAEQLAVGDFAWGVTLGEGFELLKVALHCGDVGGVRPGKRRHRHRGVGVGVNLLGQYSRWQLVRIDPLQDVAGAAQLVGGLRGGD